MRALLLLAAVALAAAPLAAQGGTAKDRVKTTRRGIEAIGMDGPLLAYDLSSRFDPGCNRLYVWNVNTNGGTVVSGAGTCEADDSSTGAGVTEIAVAGKQVAWIVNEGGNTESDDYLYTASLPKPKEKQLLSAFREGDVDQGDLDGDWIAGLVGDGGVLAVSTGTTTGGVTTKAAVSAVGPRSTRRLLTRKGPLVALAAGAGRIAVSRSDTAVKVYTAAGRLVRTFPGGRNAALTASRLLLLSGDGLDVFDVTSGAKVATRPAPAGAHLLDAEGDVAVYAVGQRISGVRLSTGRTAVLAVAPGELAGLQLEPAGLVYAYNTRKGGHLVVRPLSRVEAALR